MKMIVKIILSNDIDMKITHLTLLNILFLVIKLGA